MSSDPSTAASNGQTDASADGAPPHVPDHQLVRRIGHGSYGEVWLARNVLGTWRAVKVVYRRAFDHARPYEREFSGIQRFEPVSRTHPSLVDVLQVGRSPADDYFYSVMELADDARATPVTEAAPGVDFPEPSGLDPERYVPRTLAEEIRRRGRLPVSECVRIALTLVEAVGELHRHGLIHRDIKPSSIIFVSGWPKLADIGLVTALDQTSSFVGTEGYIAPEGPGSVQGDIYSLGKVLYEAATGKDRREFPELPTHLGAPDESRALLELNEVILRACAPQVQARYGTAEAMRADLLLLQSGKSVRRLRLTERRLAWLTRVVLGISVVAVLLLGAYAIQRQQSRRFEALARENQRLVNESRAQLARLHAANGLRLMEDGNHLGALSSFVHALKLATNDVAATTTERVRIGAILRHGPRLVQAWFHPSPVSVAVFSPDRRKLFLAQWGEEGQIWDPVTGQPLTPPLEASAGVSRAVFSDDNRRLLTVQANQVARLWDTQTGKALGPPLDHRGPIQSLALTPSGSRVVIVASEDPVPPREDSGTQWRIEPPRQVHFWDPMLGREVFPAIEHARGVTGVAVRPDGTQIATACRDGTLRLWESASGARMRLIRLPSTAPDDPGTTSVRIRYGPEGRRLLVTRGSRVQIWDADAEGGPIVAWSCATPIREANFGPQGGTVLTVGETYLAPSEVALWNATDGQPVMPPLRMPTPLKQALFSPDGAWLLTVGQPAGPSDEIRVWNRVTAEPLSPWLPCPGGAAAAGFTPDGSGVVLAGGDGVVRVWSLVSLDLASPMLSHALGSSQSAQPGGGEDQTSPPLLTFLGQEAVGADFSRDGRRLATGAADGTIRVWDVTSGERLAAWASPPTIAVGHSLGPWKPGSPLADAWASISALPLLQSLAFSPAGRQLCSLGQSLSAPDTSVLSVWSLPTNGAPSVQTRVPGAPSKIEFSPDGEWIVVQGGLGPCGICESRTGQPVPPTFPIEGTLERVSFSADGRWLAAACRTEGTNPVTSLTLWDRRDRRQVVLARESARDVSELAFSPDSRWLVVVQTSHFRPRSPLANLAALASSRPQLRVWNIDACRWQGKPCELSAPVQQSGFRVDLPCLIVKVQETLLRLDLPANELKPIPWQTDRATAETFLSPDGRWLLTARRNGTIRLWDVDRGEPITPELCQGTPIAWVVFSADSRYCVTGGGTAARLWDFSPSETPIALLEPWIQLAGGPRPELDAGGHFAGLAGMSNLWSQLRTRYPAELSSSDALRRRWHELRASRCEAQEEWFAARFHLEWLTQAVPADPQLQRRLVRAQAQAAVKQLR